MFASACLLILPPQSISAIGFTDVGRVRHLEILELASNAKGPFWRPDGNLFINQFPRLMEGIGEPVLIAAYRYRSGRSYPRLAIKHPDSPRIYPCETNVLVAAVEKVQSPEQWVALGRFPRESIVSDVSIGVADGPWHVSVAYVFRHGEFRRTRGLQCLRGATWKTFPSGPGSLALRIHLPQQLANFASEVVALDGRKELSAAGSRAVGDDREFYFRGKKSQVTRFEIRTCAYSWVTFQRVHFSPARGEQGTDHSSERYN